MRRMEEEDRKEQEELRGRIKQLESDVDQYSHMVMKWQARYREREMECERERQSRKFLENEVELLRKGMVDGTDAVRLPPRPTQQGYAGNQSTKKQDATDHTCGNCDGDYCKCVDDALKASAYSAEDAPAASFKRPHSPPSATDNKRSRHASDLDNTEIDFTSQFATPARPTLSTSASTSTVSIPAVAPPDPCGFCDDGTACLCAEMAKDKAFSDDLKPQPPSLPTLIQKTTNGTTNTDPCINGPGTCKQCLSDPKSTLFCKTVAANRNSLAPNPNKPKESPTSTQTETNSTTEPTLTCADAFTTLSRHPAFDQASSELGSWVPQLAAARKPASRPDRTAYEIEAASVMAVLKFFDRRFGKDGERVNDRYGNGAGE